MERDEIQKVAAENIRYCRGTATRKELAEWAGVTAAAITNVEHLNSMPTVELLLKLSRVFGVSIDDLLDRHLPRRHTQVLSSSRSKEQNKRQIANRLDVSPDDLMTIQDAAKELGVTKSRVIQLLDTYHITCFRTDAQLLLTREQFDRIPKIRKPGRPMSGD